MTTPTPEAIEAAARALYDLEPWQKATYSDDTYTWEALTPGDRSNYYHDATAALSAAYPLMEAQAKAEALREAADEMDRRAEQFDKISDNPKDHDLETIIRYGAFAAETRSSAYRLRARAATIAPVVTP